MNFSKAYSRLLVLVSCIIPFALSSCSFAQKNTLHSTVHIPVAYLKIQKNCKLLPAEAKDATCQGPAPYRGNMIFRSRYEGSGHARDKLNIQAEQAYISTTKQFTQLQKFLASQTDAVIKEDPSQNRVNCILQTLETWANKSDILRHTDNHTGKAVRKWTLAAIASNLLKIDQIADQYDPKRFSKIKTWVGQIADQVVSDWSNLPLKKINNHSYWAAWAVMTSAALLDRKDLFTWSKNVFSTAMDQVDEKGFLPNELRRRSRARLYHNYALTPLVGIAVFLQANNVDPFQLNNGALERLSVVVIKSMDNPIFFEKVTGVPQVPIDLTAKGRLSWIAMCSTLHHSSSTPLFKNILQLENRPLSFKSSRLGGDVRFIFSYQNQEITAPVYFRTVIQN